MGWGGRVVTFSPASSLFSLCPSSPTYRRTCASRYTGTPARRMPFISISSGPSGVSGWSSACVWTGRSGGSGSLCGASRAGSGCLCGGSMGKQKQKKHAPSLHASHLPPPPGKQSRTGGSRPSQPARQHCRPGWQWWAQPCERAAARPRRRGRRRGAASFVLREGGGVTAAGSQGACWCLCALVRGRQAVWVARLEEGNVHARCCVCVCVCVCVLPLLVELAGRRVSTHTHPSIELVSGPARYFGERIFFWKGRGRQ